MAAFDYYTTLGVERGASAAQIKQAYRKLALRSHPDVNKAADAQEVFSRIAEAYSVLGDPKQREEYDRKQRVPGEARHAAAEVGLGLTRLLLDNFTPDQAREAGRAARGSPGPAAAPGGCFG